MKPATEQPCRHFLADLHLSPDLPELTQAFLSYLEGPARGADEIFLLGDIFEYWLGDDVSMPDYADVIQALAALPASIARYFAAGNRDFLLGAEMAQRCRLQRIAQPTLLTGHVKTVVLHGDQLCVTDRAYQRYRRIVHQRWVQGLFLRLPQSWRRRVATKLRAQSQLRQQQPGILELTDASPDAADEMLARYSAQLLVHGHTHRPARHQHPHGQREVLPDWRPGQPRSFGWLVQDEHGLRREILRPPAA